MRRHSVRPAHGTPDSVFESGISIRGGTHGNDDVDLLHAAFVYQAPDGEVEALRDVSLDVEEGEFCSIVGPSGCGKSTLLSALAGLEPLDRRRDRRGRRGPGPLARAGFMPQQDQLFPWRTSGDNVTLALAVRGEYAGKNQARVRSLLSATACGPSGISGRGSCPAVCASAAPWIRTGGGSRS